MGSRGAKPLKLREFCRFSTLKNNFFLVPDCMGFEELKYSPPQQSPEKHKLISHSKQEDKKPLRSYQFGSSADRLVVYVFAVRPVLISEKAFKSFDRSPVNNHKLKKKVFRLLSNSSF